MILFRISLDESTEIRYGVGFLEGWNLDIVWARVGEGTGEETHVLRC